MHGFEKRSITPTPPEQEAPEVRLDYPKPKKSWIRRHFILSTLILILGVLTTRGVISAIKTGNFTATGILSGAVGEEVQMDEAGHTNILILGVGGEGHEGQELTDTMIIASIDHDKKEVAMLSIPRDIYVENDVVGWGTRLNGIYELILSDTGDAELAMNELIGEIEFMFNVPIHYYAKIDFQGFVDVIDAMGGVEINVDETINDLTYPAPKTSNILYDPFYLAPGLQVLDGETALKYVRSRHGSNDFTRAARQQEVLMALKDQALSAGFLLNPGKIKSVLNAISANFETNMSVTEIIHLAGQAEQYSTSSISSAVLNDAAYQMGGFLYTPNKEDYNDALVLVPYAGDWSELALFAQVYLYHSAANQAAVPIQILNATETPSVAGLTKMYLVRHGFNVVSFANAPEKGVQETSIYVVNSELDVNSTLEALPILIDGKVKTELPLKYQSPQWETDAQIIIELGEDFLDYYREYEYDYFYEGFY